MVVLSKKEELLLEFSLMKLYHFMPTEEIEKNFIDAVSSSKLPTDVIEICREIISAGVVQELVKVLRKHLKDFRVRTVEIDISGKPTEYLMVLPNDFPKSLEEKLIIVEEMYGGIIRESGKDPTEFYENVILGYYDKEAFRRDVEIGSLVCRIADILSSVEDEEGRHPYVVEVPEKCKTQKYDYMDAVGEVEKIIALKHFGSDYKLAVGRLIYRKRGKKRNIRTYEGPEVADAEKVAGDLHTVLYGIACFLSECEEAVRQELLEERLKKLDITKIFSQEFRGFLWLIIELDTDDRLWIFSDKGFLFTQSKYNRLILLLYKLLRHIVPSFVGFHVRDECSRVYFVPPSEEELLEILKLAHAHYLTIAEIMSVELEQPQEETEKYAVLLNKAIMRKRLCVGTLAGFLFSSIFFDEIVRRNSSSLDFMEE